MTDKNKESQEPEKKSDQEVLDELAETVDESVKEKVEEMAATETTEAQSSPVCEHDPDTLEALARERADFLNYKNRANKEIEKARGLGKADATRAFLQVVDEIDRARKAGDVEKDSPFDKVAVKLEDAFKNLGLQKFGEKGEIFDPLMHEALMNREAADGDDVKEGETKIDEVVEAGWKTGDELVRTAKVTTVSK